MTSNLFLDWLITINNRMKKNNRKILLFIDNAPCHIIDQDLSNVKVVFFPPNTTSKCQPLDQGVIRSFKCYYRQKLVKHVIAQCTLAQTAEQVSITVLDAVNWISLAWNNVTEQTIKNCFGAAGFPNSSFAVSPSSTDMDVSVEVDSETNNVNNLLQQLDWLLSHIQISGPQLTAAEFIDIDSYIPVFNEWDDNEPLRDLIQVVQENDEEAEEEDAGDELSSCEQPPNISEALEMLRKLHLFALVEQPQLHNTLSDLESQLTDIYLDSKAVKQSSIKDYFSRV